MILSATIDNAATGSFTATGTTSGPSPAINGSATLSLTQSVAVDFGVAHLFVSTHNVLGSDSSSPTVACALAPGGGLPADCVSGHLSGALTPSLPNSYGIVLTDLADLFLFSRPEGTGQGTFSLDGDLSASCSSLFGSCSYSANASGVFGGTLTVTYDYLDAATGIPEPATPALFAIGLFAILRRRHSRG